MARNVSHNNPYFFTMTFYFKILRVQKKNKDLNDMFLTEVGIFLLLHSLKIYFGRTNAEVRCVSLRKPFFVKSV
jgi:hypothetical protein